MKGWQEIKELALFDTPDNPNDVLDPAPPGESMGRIYEFPS